MRHEREHDEGPTPRSRPKESRRTTRWSPALADIIKAGLVGKKDEDYVVQETIALELKTPSHDVGQALASLVREGILTGPVQHPREYLDEPSGLRSKSNPKKERLRPESVKVGSLTLVWSGEAWVHEPSYGYGFFRKPGYQDGRTKANKRELSKMEKKNPRQVVSEWDGLAYRIERGSPAFQELMNPDTKAPRPVKMCRRCGREFEKHKGRARTCPDKDSCDTSVVRGIMES